LSAAPLSRCDDDDAIKLLYIISRVKSLSLSLSLSLKKNKLSKREKIAVLSRAATRKEAYKECVKERVFFLVLMSLCV